MARLPGRVEKTVGHSIVDRVDARRAAIGEIRDLDRRRLARERQQSVVAGMRGEVHEDIDPVRADDVGELLVAERRDVAPSIHVIADQAGDGVRRRHVGVRKDLDLPSVVLSEQRQNEARYRMLAKIGRHVAYAQPAVRFGAVLVRTAERRERRHVPLGPCAMLALEIGRRVVGMVVQRQEKVAVERRQIRT